GDGTFGTNTNYAVGNNPLSVAIGDLNGDGYTDLVTANQLSPHTVSVLLGDLTLDGRLDIVTADVGTNTVSLLASKAVGGFSAYRDYGAGASPVQVAVGDLNGDTGLDIVTANQSNNTVSVLLRSIWTLPVPTLLVRFVAEATTDGIQLRWQFQEPERVSAVVLERATRAAGPWMALSPDIHRSGDESEAFDATVTPGEPYSYLLTAHL